MNHSLGFTLVELLISLTLSLIIFSFVLEVFLINQRTLKTQINLSALITRTRRVTDIFRSEIHRSEGKFQMSDTSLRVNGHTYLIVNNNLVLLDAGNRQFKLVQEVSDLKIIKYTAGIDISVHVAAGTFGKTIHVFTSLK